jgi:Rrf2 family iron-sulfur cluster assembly transcriptional regulator
MWLSTTAQNSLQAVLCIAGSADDGPVRVDEIAAALGLPRNYLSKTLHALVRAGVLRSGRGPTGGFQLADPPERLALARVIAPFEPLSERRCLVGRATCGDKHPCAAHHRWSSIAEGVEEFFNNTTIATLLGENPRATRAAREVIRSTRLSNRRLPHGSVKR